MKRFFALLLACWVLCLSVCADEIIYDPASVDDSALSQAASDSAFDEVHYDSSIATLAPDSVSDFVSDFPSASGPFSVSDFALAPAPDSVVPVESPVSDEVIDDASIETPAPVIPPVDPVVDVPAPSFTLDDVLAALPESFGSPDVVSEDVVLTGISRVSIPPVTPSSTTGLKAALLTVLGNYDPVVVVYQYNTSSSGYSSYATDIQLDYAWIASAVLLCLVIWCLFKLGGALIRG